MSFTFNCVSDFIGDDQAPVLTVLLIILLIDELTLNYLLRNGLGFGGIELLLLIRPETKGGKHNINGRIMFHCERK